MGRKSFRASMIDNAMRTVEKEVTEIFEKGKVEGLFFAEVQPRTHLYEYLPDYNEDGLSVCGLSYVKKTDDLIDVNCQRCLAVIQSRLPGKDSL